MKRIYIVLVLLSLFAGAVLTGCGGDNSTSTPSSTTSTNAPMSAPASTNK